MRVVKRKENRIKLCISETTVYSAERHPDFDKMWVLHKNFIFWCGKRLARIFNAGGIKRWNYTDFIGHLTIRFNYALHYYREEKGSFTTYFMQSLVSDSLRFVFRYESEYWSRRDSLAQVSLDTTLASKEFYQSNYFMYRAPDQFDDYWTEQVCDLFDDREALWNFLTRSVPKRACNVLLWRFRDGLTLAEVGGLLNISSERVRQIQITTLRSIKNRVVKLDVIRSLFNS